MAEVPGDTDEFYTEASADIFGSFYIGNCSNQPSGDDENRLVFSVLRADQGNVSSTILICEPRYAIHRASVSLTEAETPSGTGVSVNLDPDPNFTLPMVSNWDIAMGFRSALQAAPAKFDEPLTNDRDKNSNPPVGAGSTYDVFFRFLNTTLPHSTTHIHNQQEADFNLMNTLMDTEVFKAHANQLFTSVTAQLAKEYLMIPTNESFIGTSVSTQQRLHVRVVSLRLMEASLGLLVVVVAAIAALASPSGVTRDPSSVGGLSAVLVGSPEFVESVRSTGAQSVTRIARLLSSRLYKSCVDQSADGTARFRIQTIIDLRAGTQEEECYKESGNSNDSVTIKWWQPFSVTLLGRTVLLAVAIAAIVTLELLYRSSQRHGGIADLPSDNARYAYTYVPALGMTIIAALFGSFDSSLRIFQPYRNLRRGRSTAQQSILDDQLGKMSIQALYSSLSKRQFAVSASTLAVLLAPFLSIAVSSLYGLDTFVSQYPVVVRQMNGFDPDLSLPDYYDTRVKDGGSAAAMVMGANLSFPAWTYNELVFPELELGLLPSSTPLNRTAYESGSATLNVIVPDALRATANCSITGIYGYDLTTLFNSSSTYGTYQPYVNVSVPRGCGAPGFSELSEAFLDYPPQASYFAWMQDGVLDGGKSDCHIPLMAVLGHWWTNERPSVLLCKPYMQQVAVNVTFSMPDFSINLQHPPVTIESTATYFSDAAVNATLDGRFQQFVDKSNNLTQFFSTLVHGRDGIPITELAGPSNEQRLINAVDHQYRVLMAQVYNTAMRVSSSSSSPTNGAAYSQMLSGTLTAPNRNRIVQDRASTYVLEGILAAMVICVIISWVYMDTRRVLPKNPCSIAAVASLLAGSEILGQEFLGRGAEWLTDEELWKKFEGWTFSLGWWEQAAGGRRRFGIDVGNADESR
ncbi:hypothetical protein H2199_007683 [Coniosporium tulheliwenetii]|uniref:Uncharacterized protein n=1 Tax=Coniosporium tulheliwenetii TaxID=3383036 RepID=A0ACC2YNU0_9PEZI|nr:hypothetical protein H2199_007683 [Cladosporium sp. JES 115]